MSDSLARLKDSLADRYIVDHEIGAGGMATVYLARDIRHDRPVALKVLKPELGAILGVERFLAEIKVTANLQHPNLLPLFDSGEAEGLLFYVMPFVEGESLRVWLDREKQLPVDEAVHIAVAIASALDYAHKHGVIHRDLKPENILMQSGQPMVADFGIALAVSNAGGNRITQTGLSLGTPQYMSPEQATGDRVIDGRSDIYSLAAMTYEMLTGEPPHVGSTAQAIIARVLTEHPRSVRSARPAVPEQVQWAIERGLAKLPADRWSSAHEFASAIQGRGGHLAAAGATGVWSSATDKSVRSSPAGWRTRIVASAATVTVMSVGLVGWSLTHPQAAEPVTRYALALPAAHAPATDRMIAISPDGALLAYVGPGGEGTQVWIKARDHDDAAPLAGTSNVISFTFSPNSQWIAFIAANSQVKKVPILGGAAITIADSGSSTRGITWLDDGSIVYLLAGGRELRRKPEGGGPATVIWKADSGAGQAPAALPGSRGVLFTRCVPANCSGSVDLFVADLKSGKAHRLLPGVNRAIYASTGDLLYVRPDGTMLAAPFDPKALELKGASLPIRDSVAFGVGGAVFAVSGEGTFVARTGSPGSGGPVFDMVWIARDGREAVIDTSWHARMTVYGGNAGWALSPDGHRLAIGLNTEAGDQVWVKQVVPAGPISRVSFDSLRNFRPRWSRDGKTLMFVSIRGATANLYRRPADGTGSDEMLAPALHLAAPGVFEGALSPDGKWLVIRAGGAQNLLGARDIVGMQLGVDTAPRPLVASPTFDESGIAISPDGRWLAYESTETGHSEVFIKPFPNTDGGKWQVSTDGGRAPLWARNGREIFFVNGARDMIAVPITTGASPVLGTREKLFHLSDDIYLENQENYTPFDISPDGMRFIMARRARTTGNQVAPLVVVENWFAELRRRTQKQ
jgi:dipeptidyl aminopeptidase/acylaminoacyl peptidase